MNAFFKGIFANCRCRTFLLIFLALGCNPAIAQDGTETIMNPGHNGAWVNRATAGQGFLLDVMPETNIAFLAWFTYDTSLPGSGATARVGDPGHRWLTAQGPIEGNTANLDVYLTSDGLFDDQRAVQRAPEGSIRLAFEDCTSGTVDFDLTGAGLSGQVPIERIVGDNVALCRALGAAQATQARAALATAVPVLETEAPVAAATTAALNNCKMNPGHNGAWVNRATAGQGFLLDVMPETNIAFLAWFTYDTSLPGSGATARVGDPGHRWLTAQGPIEGNTANLDVYLTSDGLFDDQRAVQRAPEGSIRLAFEDCTSGTVDFDLTGAGLSGQIPIERIVGDNVSMCQSLCGEVKTEASGKRQAVIGQEGGLLEVIDNRGNVSRLSIPEGVLVGASDHRIEASPLSTQTILPTGHSPFAGMDWNLQPGGMIGPAKLEFRTGEAERFADIAAFHYGYQGEGFYFVPLIPSAGGGVILEVPVVSPGVTGLAYLTRSEMEQWAPPARPARARYLQQMALAARRAIESQQRQQTERSGIPTVKQSGVAPVTPLEDELDVGEVFLPHLKQWFDNEIQPRLGSSQQGCEIAGDIVAAGIEWFSAVQEFGLDDHAELQGRLNDLVSAMDDFTAAAAQDIAALDRQCDAEQDPCAQTRIMQQGAGCAQTVQYLGGDEAIAELACQDAPAVLSVSPQNIARCPGASIQFYATVRNLRGDALPEEQLDLLWLSESPQLLAIGAESGQAETLAPGSSWVTASSEVCGQTMAGSALVNINGVPDIEGSYSLVGSETWLGCLDPEDNGVYGISGSASISIVSEDEQAGTAQFSGSSDGSGFGASFSGTVRCGGSFSGSGSYSESDGTSGSTSFNGIFAGNSLRLDFTAQDLSGDTCNSSGWVQGNK